MAMLALPRACGARVRVKLKVVKRAPTPAAGEGACGRSCFSLVLPLLYIMAATVTYSLAKKHPKSLI